MLCVIEEYAHQSKLGRCIRRSLSNVLLISSMCKTFLFSCMFLGMEFQDMREVVSRLEELKKHVEELKIRSNILELLDLIVRASEVLRYGTDHEVSAFLRYCRLEVAFDKSQIRNVIRLVFRNPITQNEVTIFEKESITAKELVDEVKNFVRSSTFASEVILALLTVLRKISGDVLQEINKLYSAIRLATTAR